MSINTANKLGMTSFGSDVYGSPNIIRNSDIYRDWNM